jgi:predicted lipoprotein with Yx(FWY)xxD motif
MVRTVLRTALMLAGLTALVGVVGAQSQYTIDTHTAANGVKYLTDANGMTLYYFTKDTTGQSVCTGGCADKWPIFYTPDISVPPALNASDFGTITRSDGQKETTYLGWPLYYWFQDKNPGDMKGEGVGNVWYILEVPAYTVMIGTEKDLGNYLVDGHGNTLYYFTRDAVGKSDCNGNCIKNWPAFSVSSIVVPSALNASDFGSITRADGKSQVTYKGYPLYYFARDKNRGDVTGEGVNSAWYVIDPASFPPMHLSMGSRIR